MLQESPSHILPMADTPGCLVHLLANLSKVIRREVGHISVGDIRPEIFRRIQLGRVGRQELGHQPRFLASHIALDPAAAMGGQPIPQKYQPPALEILAHGGQVCRNLMAFDRSRHQPQGQPYPPTGGSCDQRGDCREIFPVEMLGNNRGLALGSPASPNRRALGKAALVQKTYISTQFFCFFLIRGHSTRIHRRMRASSRSFAFRTGRWQLQPIWRRIFQTCPR